MTRLGSVLSTADLPAAELAAARLDGELFGIGECFAPIDVVETPSHRAAAIAAVVPSRLIAEQRTAAWIWGAIDRVPDQHQFCASIGARVRPAARLRITVREVVIDDDSTTTVAGLLVTTILRTILDLSRFSEDWSAQDDRTIASLLHRGRLSVSDCIAELESRRNLPGKRRAVDRIEAAAARRGTAEEI